MKREELKLFGMQYVIGLKPLDWSLSVSKYNDFISELSKTIGNDYTCVVYPYSEQVIEDVNIPIMSVSKGRDFKLDISKSHISINIGLNFVGFNSDNTANIFNMIRKIYKYLLDTEKTTTSRSGCAIDISMENNPNGEVKKLMNESFLTKFNVSGDNRLSVKFVEKKELGGFICNSIVYLNTEATIIDSKVATLDIQLDINTKFDKEKVIDYNNIDDFIKVMEEENTKKIEKLIALTEK